MKHLLFLISLPLFIGCGQKAESFLNDKELLGKQIFFDENLSEPMGQSCGTCHEPEKGFADKDSRMISEGAVHGFFSNRNAMTISYAAYVPGLYFDSIEETYIGGLFWDGRALDLAHQAGQPFLNLLEMGNPDKHILAEKIRKASYYKHLVKIYGKSTDTDSIFSHVVDALVAYQSSSEVNPFSSKYDAYLKDETIFSEEELQGLALFKDPKKGNCAACHVLEEDPRAGKVLFTDHTYDNLGLPKNLDNPYLKMPLRHNPHGKDYIDLGLGEFLRKKEENGKFRVPTLRNIALTAPYGHNGFFATLKDITHFYNARDINPKFPPAEYPLNVNKEELGNLGLTVKEEDLIVLFMQTLTDAFQKPPTTP